MAERNERIGAELKRLSAEFLNRESGKQSLITVTDFELSADGRNGLIRISVLPAEMEGSALLFAQRRRSELQKYLRTHSRIGRLPRLDFKLAEKI